MTITWESVPERLGSERNVFSEAQATAWSEVRRHFPVLFECDFICIGTACTGRNQVRQMRNSGVIGYPGAGPGMRLDDKWGRANLSVARVQSRWCRQGRFPAGGGEALHSMMTSIASPACRAGSAGGRTRRAFDLTKTESRELSWRPNARTTRLLSSMPARADMK